MESLSGQYSSVQGLMRGRPQPTFVGKCIPLVSRRVVRLPCSNNGALSPHPDALRRRREAELRREIRMKELAELSKSITGGGADRPPNIIGADSVSELDWRISNASQGDKRTLVYFKTRSCESCMRLLPKLTRAARKNPDVEFLVLDVSGKDVTRVRQEMKITKIPFFQLYAEGSVVSQGSWNDIELLKSLGDSGVGPQCTLSEPRSAICSLGGWQSVPVKSGKISGVGEKRNGEKGGMDAVK